MSKLIPPAVGRQVHFHFASPDISHIAGWVSAPDNTYAATIALAHNERLVNLNVLDGSGYAYPMQSVPLRQPEDERPLGNWCEWPAHTQALANPPGRISMAPPAGEPPTLNTVRQHTHPHGEPLSSRHPVIAAAQQLDNDGNALPEDPPPTIPQD